MAEAARAPNGCGQALVEVGAAAEACSPEEQMIASLPCTLGVAVPGVVDEVAAAAGEADAVAAGEEVEAHKDTEQAAEVASSQAGNGGRYTQVGWACSPFLGEVLEAAPCRLSFGAHRS